MKTTTTIKQFACLPAGMAFISIMVFSISFTNAQICPSNKVCIKRCTNEVLGFCSAYEYKCTRGAVRNGWIRCDGGHQQRLASEQSSEMYSLLIYPNPVSTAASISFYVDKPENISLVIFDVSGRLVTTLANKSFAEGDHEIVWNVAEVNSGIYFLRMEAENYSQNQKLLVTK